MTIEPETADPRDVQEARRYVLAKYGEAVLDQVSPRTPGPATARLLVEAKAVLQLLVELDEGGCWDREAGITMEKFGVAVAAAEHESK